MNNEHTNVVMRSQSCCWYRHSSFPAATQVIRYKQV